MIISIEHTTRYGYQHPMRYATQYLRVVPPSNPIGSAGSKSARCGLPTSGAIPQPVRGSPSIAEATAQPC